MAQSEKFGVVDIGGTKIRSAIWDGYNLENIDSFETPRVSAPDFVLKIKEHLQPIMAKTTLKGVGISTAGPVDVVNGRILNPANLGNRDETWMQFAIKDDLKQSLSLPIVVDNDAAMTALGQYKHFEKKRVKDLVVLTLGTGLGIGAIVNGELARGGQNMHPELGHFVVADQPDSDYQTPLGNFPTMESYLSGFHFAKRVGNTLGRELTGSDLIHLSEKQDERVTHLWQGYSQRMAVALSNLYLIYFPTKFVFAGGFAMVAGPFFLNRTQSIMSEILQARLDSGMPLPELEISANHDDLPLLGAGYKIQELLS